MESILYKGFIIGILVSAPMGPIGLLCVQRTLNKGRWHGFFSGIGAAFSDFLYALITCLGIGMMIDFFENNQLILQLAGSLLLIFFGVYIYRSDPSKSFRKPKRSRSYWQDILSAFFVTLSNPSIIIVFIALFARFNFISKDDKMYSIILGLTSIMAGALLWWFALSFTVGKFRNKFNIRGLQIMNRILGIILLSIALFGIVFSVWELYRIYA